MKVLNVLIPYSMQPQSMLMQTSKVHAQCCQAVTKQIMQVTDTRAEPMYVAANIRSASISFMLMLFSVFFSSIALSSCLLRKPASCSYQATLLLPFIPTISKNCSIYIQSDAALTKQRISFVHCFTLSKHFT